MTLGSLFHLPELLFPESQSEGGDAFHYGHGSALVSEIVDMRQLLQYRAPGLLSPFPSPPWCAEPLRILRALWYSLPSSLTPTSAGKVLIWEWWAEEMGERGAVLLWEGLPRPRRVTR